MARQTPRFNPLGLSMLIRPKKQKELAAGHSETRPTVNMKDQTRSLVQIRPDWREEEVSCSFCKL